MGDWLTSLHLGKELITAERVMNVSRALVTVVGGFLVARFVASAIARLVRERFQAQETMLLRRLVFYTLLTLFAVAGLHQLGFRLGVLLGAAGVLTVAVGFASQTSASNLISGLFLIAERPFVVGDVIRTADVTGEVLSIDLLSVKVRTFDNLYVRLPNESLIKTTITNLTYFPIRRVDLQIGVAYKEDMARVQEILFGVADRNPLCLDEPRPLFIYQGFGASALEFQFSIWGKRENYLDLKNSLQQEIKDAFDREGIEIPFPHVSLYTGSVTEAFPVRIVGGDPSS